MSVHRSAFGGLLVLGSLLLLPSAALTQSVSGTIAGTVKDTTGAVLPGVTVEASSPALIEKTRSAVTDAQGNYRILELRPVPIRSGVAGSHLALEGGEADPADRARRAWKAAIDEIGRETDRLEDLGAAIGGDVRDPHLGHDLQHSVLDRVFEALLRLVGGRAIAAQPVGDAHRRNRFECEAGADDVGSVAEQAREVV